MAKSKIEISPEYSAQGRSHPPNSAFCCALEFVEKAFERPRNTWRVADLGCGKLRHYQLLARSRELYLVDTEKQLSTKHTDGENEYTALGVAAKARKTGRFVKAMAANDFAAARLSLDLIVCVAVLDVVLPDVRRALIQIASRNIHYGGFCILVMPRNDSTILSRCRQANRYMDGHIFAHHGTHTFFHNFRTYESALRICRREKLDVFRDMTVYRQVCLVLKKT